MRLSQSARLYGEPYFKHNWNSSAIRKTLSSAPGNGYLLSATILDVICCAAMGTAITLPLIPGHLLHLQYPRARSFLRLRLRSATYLTAETSSDPDSLDYRSKLWPEPLNSLQLMTRAAWLEITRMGTHTSRAEPLCTNIVLITSPT